MIHGSTSGISFSRILSRQTSHQDATQHTDAQQAEIQQAAEDSSPGGSTKICPVDGRNVSGAGAIS